MRQADAWEADADERERLADERERLADEREALSDERDRLTARREDELDRWDASGQPFTVPAGDRDETAELARVQAALALAEATARRAEAAVSRLREAAARAEARAAARANAAARAAATSDPDEPVWLADRRDFIAAERNKRADERDIAADERDSHADQREHLADSRERETLERERRLARQRPTIGRDAVPPPEPARSLQDLRARSEQQRVTAASNRRAAARERVKAAASGGPDPYGPMLVASFATLARELFSVSDTTELLRGVLAFTVDAVAGCDSASVVQCQGGRVLQQVGTTAATAELDEVQYCTGAGPGPDALHGQAHVYAPRLADEPRWPQLAATAARLEVGSAVCYGLIVSKPDGWWPLGTLNLYSRAPEGFGADDQEFGQILAAYLAVAVALARHRDDVDRREAALHRGLSTRDVIGQAKGILMERRRLSAGDAFDVLRRASQHLNRKLPEVAQHLADTGELPT